MSLITVSIPIPDADGAPSAWIASALIQVTGVSIAGNFQPGDRLTVYGSFSNVGLVADGVAVSAVTVSTSNDVNLSVLTRAWSCFPFVSVIRNVAGGVGLTLEVSGDDGSVTGPVVVHGTVTADQGAPNTLANGWPVKVTDGVDVLGTPANPLRVDPTGTTPQPVTQSGAWTVTANQGTNPWVISFTAPQHVIVDSGSLTVSGTVTANIGTTNGLALDATLTGGNLLARVHGIAKGATPAADATVSAAGPDHNVLDVGGAGIAGTPAGGVLSVQGVAGGTPQPVSGTVAVTQSAIPWLTRETAPTIAAVVSLFANHAANITLNIKGAPANVFGVVCSNSNVAPRYLQLHNTAGVPVAGAVPLVEFVVPRASAGAQGVLEVGTEFFTTFGIHFSVGLAFAFSTTQATFTAAAAADQDTQVIYI